MHGLNYFLALTMTFGFAARAAETAQSLNLKFVKITHGTFQMGSPTTEADREPDETIHTVTISQDFEMQDTVMTQLQWLTATGVNKSRRSNNERSCPGDFTQINGVNLCPNNPADTVSFDEIQAFIAQLNQANDGYLYRLPTEAEWEYSARSGSQTAYWFGNEGGDAISDYGWYNGNSDDHTQPVRARFPNRFGLYDMVGNVFELTQDFYGEYPAIAVTDPKGPATGTMRVIRGGGMHTSAAACRAASRFQVRLSQADFGIGFRLVRTPR